MTISHVPLSNLPFRGLRRSRAALLALLAASCAPGSAQTLDEVLSRAPLIRPQPDGMVVLDVEGAAIVKWNGRQAALVNDGGGLLRVEKGAIVRWAGDGERPTWRFALPTNGAYRVVVLRSTAAGEEGTASLNFAGPRRKSLSRFLGQTSAPERCEPFDMGEADLAAGEQTVEFRIESWTSPFAASRLAGVRLIPLEPARKLARGANDAMRSLGIDAEPELAALAARVLALQPELDRLNKETRRRDFSGFTNFQQFLEFDAMPARLAAVEQETREVRRQLDERRLARALAAAPDKLKPVERTNLDAYAAAVAAQAEAATKPYPKVAFPAGDRRPAPKTLFPTGHFDELPPQLVDEKLPQVALSVPPPADAVARRERFRARNEGAALAALCREFQSVLVPGTPGIEEFERLCRAERPREALEAYRAYFFAKLADPEAHGAVTQNILFELARDRGRGELLLRPNPWVLEKNLNGFAVVQIGGEVVVGGVGAPGAVSWVPYGLAVPPSAAREGRTHQDPFWQTPAGREAARTLEFFRCMSALPGDRAEYYSGGLFPALLASYAVSGSRPHLARWCEYVDDWAMNARRDRDDCPLDLRKATELETQFARCMLNLLRIVLDERPELARDFDAPTLARLLMTLVSDTAPYTIRARRAEMANWGIMGIAHLLHLGRFLPEFKAMDYFNREAWRLWNANMIQHRTLDGENIESWDDGHNWVDIGFCLDSVPYTRLPAGTDEFDRLAFWDQIRTDERSKLVHVSPGGNYWPSWDAEPRGGRNTLRDRPRLDPANRYPFDLIDREPEVKNRLHTILNGGRPTDARLPDACSDLSPYAGMAYLRGGWQPDADYLLLQNFRDRCQTQDDCSRTMYSLSKSERILVEAHGLVVDRKPDNRYYGRPLTGGKTDYCAQAGRRVAGDRFHTSAQFDFAEATQDAPYALHRHSYGDAYGLYRQALAADDPEPIRDVTVRRHVFGVRGEGLWLVCDRVESRGAKEHEYTQFFTLPVRVAAAGFADRVRLLAAAGTPLVEADVGAGRIRTASPGFENVSLRCFAPSALKFANVLNAKREHAVLPRTPLETIQAALKAGRPPETVMKKPAQQPVSVRWTGAGNQVFVTALCSIPAASDLSKPVADAPREIAELRGANSVTGCRVLTGTGAEVWFQSGPDAANRLACGPVSATAESLLVVRRADGGTGGLVLGCTALAAGGKPAAVPGADFEFALEPSGVLRPLQPIRRPIDTVHVLPEQDVFVDRVQVAFELPEAKTGDVELRYTLDGSDPTLESALFARPFALEKTTMVKVRPFRKGLKETPWNFRGTDAGKTVTAIFRRRAPLPAAAPGGAAPGLRFDYFEGDWPTLFSYAGFPGVLEPKKSGTAAALLDADELAKLRGTDRAFAVRYEGFAQIPATGVYTFHAPEHFLTPTMDAGYDLRVFLDGEEWFPRPVLHAENTWSVPLAAGPHRLTVSYVDYRWKEFRNEYWMAWQEEEMWRGVPVLEVSGPGIAKQPLPKAWLRH